MHFSFISGVLIFLLITGCSSDTENNSSEISSDTTMAEAESNALVMDNLYTIIPKDYSANDCYFQEEEFILTENEWRSYYADSLYYVRKYEQSLDSLEGITEEDKNNINVLITYGSNNISLEKFNVAHHYYTLLIEKDTQSYLGYSNRALANYYLNDHDNAIKDARKAIRLRPDCSFAYLTLGQVYFDMGNTRRGCACMKKVIKIADDSVCVKDAMEWRDAYCEKKQEL
ncbi:MAG: tetratricopeptide repeat protein [Bacteroidota bacterium]